MIVTLTCVKEGSKLRVKILSEGYIQHANCQFPRHLREEGAMYYIDSIYIKLIISRGRYFYSVKTRDQITVVTVYENTDEPDCAVCLSALKDTVFVPCGHYYCCLSCSQRLDKCPICRSVVSSRIARTLVDC